MGDILSGSDENDFAALGQFLLYIVQASVAKLPLQYCALLGHWDAAWLVRRVQCLETP